MGSADDEGRIFRAVGRFPNMTQLHGVVAMVDGHISGSGTTAIVPIVRDKYYDGADHCVYSIEVGYEYLHHGPRVLRWTGTTMRTLKRSWPQRLL